ncbi:unnamed protein product [Leptidea sinapis]|uniref:SET domain-containing protein n=1 Tax=Leptidea sinapis TaxID=189913 RepID=A0A5E4R4F6_9NEOP|nr:unnamed protein product [Leptidea sinapis]
MSASSEYETVAQQTYGPAASSGSMFQHVLDAKVVNMDVPRVRTPVLRAIPVSTNDGDPEPDSTNHESIIKNFHKVDKKDLDYCFSEKICESDISVDPIPHIVRIEDTQLENIGHIGFPILQEGEDSSDENYVDNTATLMQTPLNTAIVQNVTKLPQNFTINVDAAVSNIATIQNVSQDGAGSQTLWLPTILTTNAPTDTKLDDDGQPSVSQIIIASEGYMNDRSPTEHRAHIIDSNYTTRSKNSKVHILSNITLPKTSNYSQQYVSQSKEVFSTQNQVYKLSANVVSQKHFNNSVLCNKPKSQSLIGGATLSPTVINNSPVKNITYGNTFAKSTNTNKINNGANLNAIVAASSGSMQCHILSRVVSGPNKVAVHSGKKSLNTFKGKNSQGQKHQSRAAIKIIQQAGSVHKPDSKLWPIASVTYKTQPTNLNSVESNTPKVIQKVGSPTNKIQNPIPLQKVQKPDRLVLQSPCGPVLLTTVPFSTSMTKGPHYVQSGATPNLRYVQTYGLDNQLSTISQVTANQQLTAQILQSLSQPKLMLQTSHSSQPIISRRNDIISPKQVEELAEIKPVNQKRIVFGDKSTLLTPDDLIGTEERPNLLEELGRYSYHSLAFVMLDHTYALPVQKEPDISSPISPAVSAVPITTYNVSPTMPSVITTQIISPVISSPLSPIINSPAILSAKQYDLPTTSIGTTSMGTIDMTPVPVPSMPISAITYKPQAPQEDDAASIISSIEGERRPPEQGGSDTETAPEVEEEGKTRCVCDFTHDDGYMICCDRCGEWQHVDCMGIDRNNIPDAYMCELCLPRQIDRGHARAIQMRKREELNAIGAYDSDSSEQIKLPGQRRKRLFTVTTYTNTSGSCVTTYNSSQALAPLPQPTLTLPKRGPKRPKKAEIVKKGSTKRKLTDKRIKRKKEMMLTRNKFTSNISNQSHWRDLYEVAVTNHYSPELRAKIMKYSNKLGNTPNMATAITAHLCTTVPHAGGKILIATKDLNENTPIIELRGKYMLSNQHRPQLQNTARAGSQKPGPFVFFYRLPKDNTQICIDTRTYGNEARFVRRSCKPNAELQHCIVKGALHVYLVTIGVIQSNTEITVGHDTDTSKQPCACGNPKYCKVNGLNPVATRKSSDIPQREKRSRNRCYSSSSPISPPLSSMITPPIKDTVSPFSFKMDQTIKTEKKSPIKHELPPMSPIKEPILSPVKEPIMSPEYKLNLIINEEFKEEEQEFDLTAKEEMKPDIDEVDYVNVVPKFEEKHEVQYKSESESDEDITPITKEDNKPIIKEDVNPIFNEDLKPIIKENVKPTIKEEENIVIKEDIKSIINEDMTTIIKEDLNEEPIHTPEKDQEESEQLVDDIEETSNLETTEKIIEEDKQVKESRAKSACHDRSSRSSRSICVNHDSLDDKTDDSQDKVQTSKAKEKEKRKMTREERKMEAIMKAFERMERAEQRKQEVKERQKRRESDPYPPNNYNDKDDDEDAQNAHKKRKRRRGRARTASQSNRRRLNSVDSDLVTSGDEAQIMSPNQDSSRIDPPSTPMDTDKPNEPSENLGLSSACLLVEAAVGSVESAFKQPKTKKTMATEWVGRSPDRTPSPYNSPYRPSLVSATSLESLVRVASTMIGDLSGGPEYHDEDPCSPPRTPGRDRNKPPKKAKRITRSTPAIEVPEVTPPMQHSAKKRWLRQAISEESDTPCTESPPNEMVTPLKKRRLARESLSCEQNNIPCNDETSPVLTSEDSPVKDDSHAVARQYKRNIMDMYTRDRTRSDSGQGSDDQCNIDHDLLHVTYKGPHDRTEHIRRIIGVPTPEEEMPPEIHKPIDIPVNNNNIDIEECNNKVIPMDIDTTVITQTKIDSNDHNEVKNVGSPPEKIQTSQSADTSCSSSPQRDEMDDIQKKIHSFHTENIQILKSRNKKPPKEQRKKVNLNFDLNMVDDQISIQLRTDDNTNTRSDVNGDIQDDTNSLSPENIPLPPVESIPLPAPETIPLPEETNPMPLVPPPETIPLPEDPIEANPSVQPESPVLDEKEPERPSVLESTVPFSSRFNSTGLFSGIFSNISQSFKVDSSINENIPNMSVIKSAIDRTTSLDSNIFDKDSITAADDLKSVQEILTRVSNMHSNNSVLLSDVLSSSNNSSVLPAVSPRPAKPYCPRSNDPRLNPPTVEKSKPVRRKICCPAPGDEAGAGEGAAPDWCSGSSTSGSSSLSPQRLDAAAAAAVDELELRLHKDLTSHLPKEF